MSSKYGHPEEGETDFASVFHLHFLVSGMHPSQKPKGHWVGQLGCRILLEGERNVAMQNVFVESQKGLHSHGKNIKTLVGIYNSMELSQFWEEFVALLKYSLVVFNREPAVERTIDFVAKFGVALQNSGKEEKASGDAGADCNPDEDADESEMHPFLWKLFEFLLSSHNAQDKAVRFRCCQLVKKLLSNMGDNAQIDDELFDRIYECMLQRLRDKFAIVRAQAVPALARLQDPMDKDCPVINAYLFLLGSDTNVDVRRAVLSSIAVSTKTLPSILERTRDVKDVVRKLAYEVLADKVHVRTLSIAHRVRLLQQGLNDRSEVVKEVCAARMLQSWLRTFEGNMLELLNCFDVENSTEISEQVLRSLFQKSPVPDLVQNFDLLNDNLVIALEEITPEASFYWRCLCQYIKSRGTEEEDYLEKLLPNCTAFCHYLRSILVLLKEEDFDKKLQNEFIYQQLLALAELMDLSDEVGRKNLGSLIKELLLMDEVSHRLIEPLLKCYCKYQKDPTVRINQLVEIISDIQQPITVTENTVSAEQKRQLDLKIAGVRVQLNQLREEMDEHVANQNFTAAAEIKGRVTELETSKLSLIADSQPTRQEVRTEKTDADTLLKCLTIATEMLQNADLKGLIPSLQTLMETLVLTGIQNEDPAVRNVALKTLGLCCLLSKETAQKHLVLMLQVAQMDLEAVQMTALQVIFDLLDTFGLEGFQMDEESSDKGDESNQSNQGSDMRSDEAESADTSNQDALAGLDTSVSSSSSPAEQTNIANSVLAILIALLDSESSEVRTVTAEGLAKLMLSWRVVSAKLLSRLLLLWYNPVTEGDTHLRHCLGVFFPIFAFAGQANQEVVAEAFLPTLQMLFEAPNSSPLVEVNIGNVAELLVQLTNPDHLVDNNRTGSIPVKDSCAHDTIAEKVCNEVLSDPSSPDAKVYCRILNMLDLSKDNLPNHKDLLVLAEQLLKKVKDRLCLRAIEKFQQTVKAAIQRQETADKKDDVIEDRLSQQEEKEDEEVASQTSSGKDEASSQTTTDNTAIDDSSTEREQQNEDTENDTQD